VQEKLLPCLIVQVGTGHGKSVVAQLEADMLIATGTKKVLIVCTTEFLAHYGSHIYGTANTSAGKIRYVSFAKFLSIPVDTDTVVIFDEVD
jgi:hypothetical protein